MNITTQKTAIYIIVIVWVLSLGRSILIMFGGKNVFRKAYKNESSAMIPIINLFSMLDIAEVSSFWGILFFVPFLNLIPLVLMGAGLGKCFKTSGGYKLGLMFLPIVFYPNLFMSDKSYKVKDEKYFKALDSAKGENINLMTQEDIAFQNETNKISDEPKVDSIFKSDLELMEKAPTYRASRIDQGVLTSMDSLTNDFDEFAPIKKVEPTRIETTSSSTSQNNSMVNNTEASFIPFEKKEAGIQSYLDEEKAKEKKVESTGFQTYGEADKSGSEPIKTSSGNKNVEFIDL